MATLDLNPTLVRRELIHAAGPNQPLFVGFYQHQPSKLIWSNPEPPTLKADDDLP